MELAAAAMSKKRSRRLLVIRSETNIYLMFPMCYLNAAHGGPNCFTALEVQLVRLVFRGFAGPRLSLPRPGQGQFTVRSDLVTSSPL